MSTSSRGFSPLHRATSLLCIRCRQRPKWYCVLGARRYHHFAFLTLFSRRSKHKALCDRFDHSPLYVLLTFVLTVSSADLGARSRPVCRSLLYLCTSLVCANDPCARRSQSDNCLNMGQMPRPRRHSRDALAGGAPRAVKLSGNCRDCLFKRFFRQRGIKSDSRAPSCSQ
jgi:hypothetical protein